MTSDKIEKLFKLKLREYQKGPIDSDFSVVKAGELVGKTLCSILEAVYRSQKEEVLLVVQDEEKKSEVAVRIVALIKDKNISLPGINLVTAQELMDNSIKMDNVYKVSTKLHKITSLIIDDVDNIPSDLVETLLKLTSLRSAKIYGSPMGIQSISGSISSRSRFKEFHIPMTVLPHFSYMQKDMETLLIDSEYKKRVLAQ